MKGSYRQCKLKKQVPEGVMEQVAWIPTELATINRSIKLRSRGTDDWDEGWFVAAVGSIVSAEDANEMAKEHRVHHLASDAHRDADGHWVTPGSR